MSVPQPNTLAVKALVQSEGFSLDVDFAVAEGETLGVIGPNGAGKTTLLNVLAGLRQLTGGSISLAGVVLDEPAQASFVPTEHRDIGFMFQNYRLFPHLSVRDNVAFGPRCQGVNRSAARVLADLWLARIGIAELSLRKPGQLSGGQAQRVAMARVLASQPRMLLLDEPLAALDAFTRLQVRADLRRHLVEFSGPAVIVTHDPLEAMVMTDRLIVVEGGRIVQTGTPAEIARRPATRYVASLLGLNLYAGELDSATGQVRLDGGGLFFTTGDVGLVRQASPQRVLVALRPTAISLHTSAPVAGSPRNVWPATVSGIEPLAEPGRVRVQVSGQIPALVDLTAAAVTALNLNESMPVWLSAKATEIEVFAEPNLLAAG